MNSLKNLKNKLKVGLIHFGNREKSGLQIAQKLKQYDIEVKQWDVLESDHKLQGVEEVDTVVVNIGKTDFEFDDLLLSLFDKDIKVVINEAALTNQLTGLKRKSWERHLLNKIDSSFSIIPDNSNEQEQDNKPIDFKKFGFEQVWVLAASIGGPEAVQKFLAAFDGKQRILFIIVQHIDKEFLPMMQQQFNQDTKFEVTIPVSGMDIRDLNCLIYPVDEYIKVSSKGVVDLLPQTEVFTFSPCIDECCKRLFENIKDLNIAVFSGMSSDGILGAELISQSGLVITQSEESCVLSSIIEGVKKKIKVDYSGDPVQLAHYIKNKLSSQVAKPAVVGQNKS